MNFYKFEKNYILNENEGIHESWKNFYIVQELIHLWDIEESINNYSCEANLAKLVKHKVFNRFQFYC